MRNQIQPCGTLGRFSNLDSFCLGKIIPWILISYLTVYFLVPYKPWTAPISFHTPLLGLGIIFSLFRLSREFHSWSSIDLKGVVYFVLAVFFFSVSVLVNLKNSHVEIFQAYAISLGCLFFVGREMSEGVFPKIYFLMKLYLIVSGILVILQVNCGGAFYVASYFGALSPPVGAAGWGFASSHIFAGGAVSWVFCVLFAKFSVSKRQASRWDTDAFSLLALVLGAVGLFYTFNRGAWLAVLVTVLVLWLWLVGSRLGQRRFFLALLVVLFSVALVKRYLSPNVSRMSEKLSFVSDVLKAPSDTIKNDASSFTRLTAWGLSVGLIKSRPVWGVGAGQFPVLYSQAFPELYKDLPSTMYDPYPVQTSSNSYLYYAVEFGLLPALFMFVFVARAFYLAAKSGHNSPYFPFFIAGICMTLWLMTCDYIGERIFWIGLGAMSAPTFVVSRGIRGNDGR